MSNLKFWDNFYNTQKPTPAIIKMLNDKYNLPDDYSYEKIPGKHNMYQSIDAKTNEPASKFTLIFPLEFKGIEVKNIHELIKLLYNTQECFKIEPNFPSLTNLDESKNNYVNYISKYDKHFSDIRYLELKIGDKSYTAKIKRVPWASISERKFISLPTEMFKLSILYNEDTHSMRLSFNLNFDRFEKVKDFLKEISSLEKICNSKIFLGTHDLSFPDKSKNTFEQFKKIAITLSKLEEKLNVEFNMPKSVSNTDIYNLKLLYSSLIDTKIIFDNISGTKVSSYSKEDFQQAIKLFNYDNLSKQGFIMHENKKIKISIFDNTFKFMQYRIFSPVFVDSINEDECSISFKTNIESKEYSKLSLNINTSLESQKKQMDDMLNSIEQNNVIFYKDYNLPNEG